MSGEFSIDYEIKSIQDYENILTKMVELGIECEIQKKKTNYAITIPKEFIGREQDIKCSGDISHSARSLVCELKKEDGSNLEIQMNLIQYLDIPRKIEELYRNKNRISIEIRDLRNNIIDIYNHSSVVQKLEQQHLAGNKQELEDALPDNEQAITHTNEVVESATAIPVSYREDFDRLRKEYMDSEKEIEFLKLYYNKKMEYLEKRLYDLEMIRDKLENKVREIYHSIIKKLKLNIFKKLHKI